MKSIIAALVAAFCISTTAHTSSLGEFSGVTRLERSPGGVVTEFIEYYIALRDRGDRLIIAGPCASACTLFLGIMSRDRVCGIPNKARLGFHTASEMDPRFPMVVEHSVTGTAYIWSLYPEAVRRLVRIGGWNGDNPTTPHPDLVWLDTDNGLFSIIQVCPVSDWD